MTRDEFAKALASYLAAEDSLTVAAGQWIKDPSDPDVKAAYAAAKQASADRYAAVLAAFDEANQAVERVQQLCDRGPSYGLESTFLLKEGVQRAINGDEAKAGQS